METTPKGANFLKVCGILMIIGGIIALALLVLLGIIIGRIVRRKLRLQLRLSCDDLFAKEHGRLIDIEGMLQQSAFT